MTKDQLQAIKTAYEALVGMEEVAWDGDPRRREECPNCTMAREAALELRGVISEHEAMLRRGAERHEGMPPGIASTIGEPTVLWEKESQDDTT